MENSDIDNVRGLSGVDFEGDDRHSSEKVARVYEFYESGRYQEALSMAEAEPTNICNVLWPGIDGQLL